MAAKTTTKVATLTGAAKDDAFSANEGTGVYSLNVLANDPGSASLYSLAQMPGVSSSQFPIEKSASLASGATIAIVNGQVEYTNAKLQALPAGKEFTDTFTYTVRMANGALSTATATVTIIGENDAASFSAGGSTGSVTEDAILAVSGTLTVNDVDSGEAHTLAASGDTTNGSYRVDADGKWTFTATNAAIQHLGAGKTIEETFTVQSQDKTASQVVTVTINGVNDEASFGAGGSAGSVTEDGSPAASGTLAVTDADDGEAHTLAASGDTTNGSYSVDTDGNWSFSANNAAIQHLGAGKTIEETFTVQSQDKTASEVVIVTITGVNDGASISGTATGDLTEDSGVVKTSGALAVSDLDDGEAGFAAVAQTALQGKYGNFSFNEATGEWTYEMDNAAVQGLSAGDTEYETLEVSSIDGTAKQTISVAIHGADEPVVVQPPADQPADQQTVVNDSVQFVVNQGTNITNGRVIFKDFDSNDTLHYTNQFTYKGYSESDYGGDLVMDTALNFIYQKNDNAAPKDLEIILVGYTGLQESQITG